MNLYQRRLAALVKRGFAWIIPLLPLGSAGHCASPFPAITSASKFLIYYGTDFSASNLTAMSAFDVVVLDPNAANMNPSVVAYLHNHGVSYVIGYISIGEDAASVTSGTAPIAGDGTGPVYYDQATGAIVYENQGIASFYVDQAWDDLAQDYVSDGLPDADSAFGGYYIWPNAGWRAVINSQQIGAARSVAGLAQIAGARNSDTDTNPAHNFGFDGFFLDTLDTSGPYDDVPGYYPWTAQEMSNTVAYIHNTYPEKFILANRGLFFYNPAIESNVFNIHPYDYDIRPYVNGAMFESYYLDSGTDTGVTADFNDNSLNYGAKLSAEANRPDGFTIFSLDYAMNRGSSYYNQAIQQTIVNNGWVEYLSADGALSTVDTYVKDHMPQTDSAAPVWSTTGSPGYVPPSPPTPDYPARVGTQNAAAGGTSGDVIVRWDIALDQTSPVSYNIYQSCSPLVASSVAYNAVSFSIGDGWSSDPTTNVANQYQVSGLAPGAYYFRVRAQDVNGSGLIETNTNAVCRTVVAGETSNPITAGAVTLDGTLDDWTYLSSFGPKPDDVSGSGNSVDWQSCWMAHDGTNFYLAYQNQNGISLNTAYNVFIDTDGNRDTGFRGTQNNLPIGAEYLVQGTFLYQYAGSGTDWNWSYQGTVASAVSGTCAELSLPRSSLGNPASLQLFFWGDNISNGGTVEDSYPIDGLQTGGTGSFFTYTANDVSNPVASGAITVDGGLGDWSGLQSFGIKDADTTGANNQVDWGQGWLAHDAVNFYIAFQNQNPVVLGPAYNIYLHTDSHPATGYRGAQGNFPIGGDYVIEGSHLYQYAGSGTDWIWDDLGQVTAAASGTCAEFSFARALVGNPPIMKLFFYGDNTATGGTGCDVYPQNAMASNGTGKFFVYRTGDPSPFDQWLQSQFSAAQLLDPAISGDLADPDGDGVPNLLSYALGGDPWIGDAVPVAFGISEGRLALTFTRVQSASDITYHVQSSGDLINWSDVWSSATATYTGGTNASVQVTVPDTVLVSATIRRFMRLEVTQP